MKVILYHFMLFIYLYTIRYHNFILTMCKVLLQYFVYCNKKIVLGSGFLERPAQHGIIKYATKIKDKHLVDRKMVAQTITLWSVLL